MPVTNFRDERGSVTVETTVAIIFATVVLTGGLVVSYAAFAKSWVERSSYEASICLATEATTSTCETRLRRDIEQALPLGQIETIQLRRSKSQVSVRGVWCLGPSIRIHLNDDRSLPLRGSP